MWRRTSFNARSHVELTRFIWVRLLMEVGGCFLLMFFFSSGGSASPAARSWKGFLPTARSCCFCSISDWPPSILNLCQWPFCSAKSAPPQDSDFTPVMVGKVGGGERTVIVTEKNTLLISSWSPSLLHPVRRQKLQLISFIDVFCCIFQAWTTKKCNS